MIRLFRELNPALLSRADRGKNHSQAAPLQYGQPKVAERVSGAELLEKVGELLESDAEDAEESEGGSGPEGEGESDQGRSDEGDQDDDDQEDDGDDGGSEEVGSDEYGEDSDEDSDEEVPSKRRKKSPEQEDLQSDVPPALVPIGQETEV